MKTLIVCCENRGGMMFNHRRLSMDTLLNKKLIQRFKGTPFYIAEYSKSLFPKGIVFKDFENEGVYFIEDPDLIPLNYEELFDSVIVVRWNRDYPFDKMLSLNLNYYSLRSSIEFKGHSHDTITMNFYKKKGDM